MKIGDKVRAIANAELTAEGRTYKVYKGNTYTISAIKDKYIGIQVGKNILALAKWQFNKVFKPINTVTYTYKWTTLYTNKDRLRTSILWDTKEEAQAEFSDIVKEFTDAKLIKLSYETNKKNKNTGN